MPTFFQSFLLFAPQLAKKDAHFPVIFLFFLQNSAYRLGNPRSCGRTCVPFRPWAHFSGKKLLFLIFHCFFLTQFQLLKLTLRLFDTFFLFFEKKIKLKRFLLTIKN